jgi:Pyridoxamine 5'-phosphate oxidase
MSLGGGSVGDKLRAFGRRDEGLIPLVTGALRWHVNYVWIDAAGATILPASECRRLLAIAAKDIGLGRLGCGTNQAPVIVPVNFTLHDGYVVIRVRAGFLSRIAGDQLVAFEVDHVGLADDDAWSVLVRGLATLIKSPTEADLASAPEPLVPEPGGMLLTIRPDVLTGRRFEIRQPISGSRSRET